MSAPEYLNALRAFEAAARHESFSAAAAELHVTPAAVGQLVRSLEDVLGTPLFHRGTSGRKRLVLTEAAQRALPDIRAGFERLSAGVARLKEGSSTGVLTVTVSPAFAAKWLLPRLERFQAAWPELDVRLDASTELLDFAARGVDIGVRYGAGVWPGLTAEKLLDEEVYPVCSPALLRQSRRLRRPSDLVGLRLIHDRSVDARSGFATWDAWLEKAGARDVGTKRGLRINNSAAVLQAAIDGQGVALARSIMAHDDLAAGRLVRLFPEVEFSSVLSYYVVYRPDCATLPKLVAFRDWLVREASTG
ncbi:transcriptional regulator GcvA [Archangium lipolyticum]|uniref:transcriptional regulator GcvA n=1 Tax=Archangium lipolyticum TaxID=2970465 RepID=UPI002149FEAF|nr:transcriptional regulator GcvA [Archangium lipolyticum]